MRRRFDHLIRRIVVAENEQAAAHDEGDREYRVQRFHRCASPAATSAVGLAAPLPGPAGRRNTVNRRLASTVWSFAELRLKRISSSAAYGTVISTFSQKRRSCA